jgi:hypothetical protein
VGQELKFNDIRFNVTGFYRSNQLETECIGIMAAENTKNVTTYGVEAGFISIRK